VSIYDVGDVATLDFTVELDEVLTDPTTITLTITDPDGGVTTKSLADVTRVSAGVYTYDQPVTIVGDWRYTWLTTGTVATAESGTFTALPTDTDQVTLSLARRHLNFDDDEHTDDAELGFFLIAANEWMAAAVTDLTPAPVLLGTLELIRHWWETQRGPGFDGTLSDDGTGLGLRGFAIPNRVRELISPWAAPAATGAPLGSFPDAPRWPDAVWTC